MEEVSAMVQLMLRSPISACSMKYQDEKEDWSLMTYGTQPLRWLQGGAEGPKPGMADVGLEEE